MKQNVIVMLLIINVFPSMAASFDNSPNFDTTTADQKDQREYTKENAAKSTGQGGYFGGHDTITSEAALLKKDVHSNNQDFKKWIDEESLLPLRVGAHDEDSTKVTIDIPIVTPDPSLNLTFPVDVNLDDPPLGSTGDGDFFSHFFDRDGKGLKGRGTPATQRAKDYIREIGKIGGCVPGGINAPGNEDKKKRVYEYFGKTMHLLEDMAVPSHTTDDAHPFRKSFEEYVNDHWDQIVNASSFSNKVTPENYRNGNYRFENIEDAMKALAEKSRQYPNEEQIYDCFTDPNSGMQFCGPNEDKLKGNAADLIPEAIMYTAGLIDSIYDYMSGGTSDQAKCALLYHFLGPGGDHPDDRFDVSDGFYWEKQFGLSEVDLADLSIRTAMKKDKIGLWYWKRYLELYALGTTLPPGVSTEVKDSIESQFDDMGKKLDAMRDRERDDLKTAPDIALFAYGFHDHLTSLLLKFKEPVAFIGLDFDPSIVKDHPIMVVPSGGLYGLETSAVLRAQFDEYVKQGGTLVVFAQQHGYEFSLLPTPSDLATGVSKPVAGYGWAEDQSCLWNGTYIDTFHPAFSAITSPLVSANVDGYFTSYPDNASILLRRTVNSQPAMLMYDYGRGKVIVSSLYSDWGYAHAQATQDEIKIVRDLISWAKKPALLPEIRPGESLTVDVEISNITAQNVSSVKFLTYDPDRMNLMSTANVNVELSPDAMVSVPILFVSPSNSPPGIYHIDYELYDSSGNILQPAGETDSGRLAVSNPAASPYKNPDLTFSVNADEEHYLLHTDATFTIIIWNSSDADRQISVNYYTYHLLVPSQWKTISVAAHSSASFQVVAAKVSHEGWLVAKFYDEGGKYISERWKGVWMDMPSADVHVMTDSQAYAKGAPVSLSVNLQNTTAAKGEWTADVKVWVQGCCGHIYDQSASAIVSQNGSTAVTDSFTLPADAQSGIYTVVVSITSGGYYVASASSTFELPQSSIETTPIMPQVLSAGSNTIQFSLSNSGKAAVNSGILSATVKDPDGLEVSTVNQSFALSAGEEKTVSLQIVMPNLKYGYYSLMYRQSDETKEGSPATIRIANSGSMSIIPDKISYNIGETATVSISVVSHGTFRQEGDLIVSAPLLGLMDTKAISADPGNPFVAHYSLDIPFTAEAAATINATFTDKFGNTLSRTLQLTIAPLTFEQEIKFDKASYRVRETVGFTYTLNNNGKILYPVSMPLQIAIPDLNYTYDSTVQLRPGEETRIPLSFTLPDTVLAGQHLVIVLLTLPSGETVTKSFAFTVPESLIKITYAGQTDITPDDLISLTIENAGGVDTSYATMKLVIADSSGVAVSANSASGDIQSAESKALAVLAIPRQAVTGPYYLIVEILDEGTGKRAAFYKTLNVSGVTAEMQVATTKDAYLSAEAVSGVFDIASGIRAIEGGWLNLSVQGMDIIEEFTFFMPDKYWPFSSPLQVTASPDGRIYILDSAILMYDLDGNFISRIEGSGMLSGQLNWVSDLTAAPDGSLFVTDDYHYGVIKLDRDGNFIKKWRVSGSGNTYWFGHKLSAAASSDGSLFVVDPFDQTIQKYDSNGNLLLMENIHDSASCIDMNVCGKFHDLAVGPDGYLYLAHSAFNKIQKYDHNGIFQEDWGDFCITDTDGDGMQDQACEGSFNKPQGIAVSPDGVLYIADSYNNRIQKSDIYGNFMDAWGTRGTGGGQFDEIRGIAIGTNNMLYAADTGNSRIKEIDAAGNVTAVWATSGSGSGQFIEPNSLAFSLEGAVYVADRWNYRIEKFDRNGNFVAQWGSQGSGDGQFHSWISLAVGESDAVYVADDGNVRVQRFDRDGNFINAWGEYCSYVEGDPAQRCVGQFSDLSGVATAQDGSLYVVERYNNRVQKFDRDGNFLMMWGGYCVSDSNQDGIPEQLCEGKFYQPSAVAVGLDGSVYISDSLNNRVQKFDGNGVFKSQWGGYCNAAYGACEGKFSYSYGLAVDRNNSVYVIDANNQRIQKFDQNGNYVVDWNERGTAEGQFSYPQGIATAPDGSVYVADTGNDRIQRLTKKAGEVRTLFDTTLPVDQPASSVKHYIEEIGVVSSTGMLYLMAELQSSIGQTLATAEYPFSIIEGNMALSINTDRRQYRVGEMVTVSGRVSNLSLIDASSLDMTISADGTELYTSTITVPASGTHPFSFTAVAGTEGLHLMSGRVVKNDAVLAETVQYFDAISPNVTASVMVPDVVDSEPFDLIVELRNHGGLAAQVGLAVNSAGSADFRTIDIPAGQVTRLHFNRQIDSDATFTFSFSGDLELFVEKNIVFGKKANLSLNIQPVYSKGEILIPYTISNAGLIEAMYPASFVLLKDGLELVRNDVACLLPANGQDNGTLRYDLLPGSYILRYGTVGSMIEADFAVIETGQGVLSLSEKEVYSEGAVEIPFSITNSGMYGAEYTAELSVASATVTKTVYLPAGGSHEDTAHFVLAAGEYIVQGSMLSYPAAGTTTRNFTVLRHNQVALETFVDVPQETIPVSVNIMNLGFDDCQGTVKLAVLNGQDESLWIAEQAISAVRSRGSESLSFDVNATSILPGTYILQTEFRENSNRVLAESRQPITISGAVIHISELPVYRSYASGEPATFDFKLRNTGNKEGSAELAFRAYDMVNVTRAERLRPGEEKTISFSFVLPGDLETKDYFADYELRAEGEVSRGQIRYHLSGIELNVQASLNKQSFAEGEAARLVLLVTSSSQNVQSLSARVNYSGYEEFRSFTLQGSHSLMFDIPLTTISGEKLFYGIYHESGRSIHLNSLYVYKAGDVISITTGKEVFAPGESVSISITSAIPGTMALTLVNSTDTFSFAGAASRSIQLPDMLKSGTYAVTAELTAENGETYSAGHSIDISGIQVKVLECRNDKGKYAAGDAISTTFTISSNVIMPATLKAWVAGPDSTYMDAGTKDISLSPSENAIISLDSQLSTTLSGVHRLIYGIYSGELLLVSGSEAFDVGDAFLLGLRTDKIDYPASSEPVTAKISMFGKIDATLELQLDGTIVRNQPVSLDGFSTIDIDLGIVPPGSHSLKGTLISGGLKSSREIQFIYGTDLPDLTAEIRVPHAVADAGKTIQVVVTAANHGKTFSAETSMALYDGNNLIEQRSLPGLAPYQQQETVFDWDVFGKSGEHTLKAVMDPENRIVELREENNTATAIVAVTDLSLTLSTERDMYGFHQEVHIASIIDNLSSVRTYETLSLETTVHDPLGSSIFSNLFTISNVRPMSSVSFGNVWNTGDLSEGVYRITQELISDAQLLAVASKTITLRKHADFGLRIENNDLSIGQGGTASLTVQVDSFSGWSSLVTFEMAGVPPNTAVSFMPGTLVPPGSVVASLVTSASTPPGEYSLLLSAKGLDEGVNVQHALSAGLTVAGYGIDAEAKHLTIKQAEAAVFSLTATAHNIYDGSVTLSADIPVGLRGVFEAEQIPVPGQTAFHVLTSKHTKPGDYILTVRADDGILVRALSLTITVEDNPGIATGIMVAPGPGRENPALVRIFNTSSSVLSEFIAFPGSFGASIAAGDIDGDGKDEIIVGQGPSAANAAVFRVFSKDGSMLGEYTPFDASYGLTLSTGDLDGDMTDEIVVGMGPAPANPSIIKILKYQDGTFSEIVTRQIYNVTTHGVVTAIGDIDGDGRYEVVTAPGPGKNNDALIKVFKVNGNQLAEIFSFDAFAAKFGAQIAVADVNDDGKEEIIAGTGPSPANAALIRVFAPDGTLISQIRPFGRNRRFGATVAAADLDGDGRAEIIAGLGPDPLNPPKMKILNSDGMVLRKFLAYPKKYRHGVRVFTGKIGR